MELLRTLSLVYAAVLVLALAVSLVTIWIYLRKIGAALGGAREALADARRESAVLPEHLEPLESLSAEAAGELEAAEGWLREADEALTALLDRKGMRELAR